MNDYIFTQNLKNFSSCFSILTILGNSEILINVCLLIWIQYLPAEVCIQIKLSCQIYISHRSCIIHFGSYVIILESNWTKSSRIYLLVYDIYYFPLITCMYQLWNVLKNNGENKTCQKLQYKHKHSLFSSHCLGITSGSTEHSLNA